MIARVKGTHDRLDLSLYNYVLAKASQHFGTYNFTEISTPILEHIELFKRSLGVYTDVVSKEMFLIDNKGSEPELCLRPELTASIVRAFVENNVDTVPWKVFSSGPAFRYERPQKGRYREFHHISVEMIGVPSLSYDVECIVMLNRFFSDILQFDNYALHLNFLGTPAERITHAQKLVKFLNTHNTDICETCQVRKEVNPLRVFDCKNEACITLYVDAPMITDCLSPESEQAWQQVQSQLGMLGVSYTHRPTLVRGLDYYNKTVFEFVSGELGAQNTFCGGGRYDYLVSHIGGKQDQPSIGAAIGIERLLMLLEPISNNFLLPQKRPLTVIIPVETSQHPLALYIADHVRRHGICVDTFLEESSLKGMMRKANKWGAHTVLIVGEEEQRTQTVTIKHMTTGETKTVPQIDVVKYLQK
jgi:histidyl-tRNA synthetase